jgi:hypothetical protein
MKATLSPSDIFEIRKTSLISNNDYEYALDLYAPIIGIKNVINGEEKKLPYIGG